jgi:hypothetical protein
MPYLRLILLVFAFVFAVLSAGGVPSVGRVNWLGAAIAFLIAAQLFG